MVVWNWVLSSPRYLAITSEPLTLTSAILPASASLRSVVRLTVLSWPPPFVLTTNCHKKTRQAIMETQIRICLTVEFKAYFLIFPVLQEPEAWWRLIDRASWMRKIGLAYTIRRYGRGKG